MRDDDRAAIAIAGLFVAWGVTHLAPCDRRVLEAGNDIGASPAPSAAGVEREVAAGLPGPSDAAERFDGRGRTTSHLPGAVSLATVPGSGEMAPGLVQADGDKQLRLCPRRIGRRDLDRHPFQLGEPSHVAMVGMQPEEQTGEHVHHHHVEAW